MEARIAGPRTIRTNASPIRKSTNRTLSCRKCLRLRLRELEASYPARSTVRDAEGNRLWRCPVEIQARCRDPSAPLPGASMPQKSFSRAALARHCSRDTSTVSALPLSLESTHRVIHPARRYSRRPAFSHPERCGIKRILGRIS